jgi:ubiquitin C-terminal hydrolase
MSTIGLQNLGNTCFLNSCVQILSMIPEFRDNWRQKTNTESSIEDKCVLFEWTYLQEKMISLSTPAISGFLNPQPFIAAIQKAAQRKGKSLFSGWAQNDMPEFLLFFIDTLHSTIQRSVHVKISGKPSNHTDQLAISCYSMLRETYAREYSECMELFFGTYISQIRLSNDSGQNDSGQNDSGQNDSGQNDSGTNNEDSRALSVKPEHFFMVDLPLPSNKSLSNGITLYDCFDLFCAPEWLEGDNAWKNEATGKMETRVSKTMTFWSFPPILILVMKRFIPVVVRGRQEYQKFHGLIDFPVEGLNLAKYLEGYRSQKCVYDLFGVGNHYGSCQGGHYTAFAKPGDGIWRVYDDSHVRPISPQEIVTPAAYCLFYRRRR